ncbi:hypothetical protein ABBQ32_007546 [Trebouxia sp. C0010 RCD-2024]
MDVYFNELIHPYQDSTSMLIKLLDRQSLTEVDHNRGLKQALQLAQECKSLLRTEAYDEAIVVFVKAFATSPFCLEPLEEVNETLEIALKVALHNHMRRYKHRPNWPIPCVCQAAKLIMLGFNMIATPPLQEAFNLITDDSAVMFEGWDKLEEQHCLSSEEVSWVMELATFKCSYGLALHCTMDRHRQHYGDQAWEAFAVEAKQPLYNMRQHNQSHPFALQGTVQWDMLVEDPAQPFVLHWDDMQEVEGYETAVHMLGDPALAVTHLVQTMYTNLQACYGQPSYNQKKQLRRTADRILQCIDVLQADPSVWDNVRGKILTALFLLAHTWDMGSLLAISSEAGNHMLVSFIHKQHSLQRELLLRPEPTFEELAQDLEEINSLVDRLPAHTRSNEDRQFTDLRCMRCERHISTKSEAMECQQCHSAVYCSPECQKKHAQLHKGPCKRAKLKAKLAAKPSAK